MLKLRKHEYNQAKSKEVRQEEASKQIARMCVTKKSEIKQGNCKGPGKLESRKKEGKK